MRTYLHPRKTYIISVIIPLYNAEKYIAECFDSLLAQTFQNFEVIVVDDCSTDNSAKIVESYAPRFNVKNGELRFTFTTMQKNTGSGALPRNKGLSLSQSEYILFLDADDMLTSTALEELYGLAKEYDADVVYCEKHYEVDEYGKNLCVASNQKGEFVGKPTVETNSLEKRVQAILNDRYLTEPWNKFVKRDFIMTNKIFFPAVKISEDNVWTQGLVFYAKRFLRVPNPVCIHRMSQDSMVRQQRTPQQRINFWLNPVMLGLKSLEQLMNRQEFFLQNPSKSFALLKKFVDSRFRWTLKYAKQLTEEEIYTAIKNEFAGRLGEHDILISMLCSALYDEKNNYLELANMVFMARLDIKFVSAEGDFQIISVSDKKAYLEKPSWLNKNGVGYCIRSYAGKLEFIAKATVKGKIVFNLKARDVRDPDDKTKRIPYWIDYTKLTINGKTIFDTLTPAWHDKPYQHTINAKADEEITVQVEWQPHMDKRIDVPENAVKIPVPSGDNVKPKIETPTPKIIAPKPEYDTARLDVKFASQTAGSDFKILSLSDDNAEVNKPAWFQKNGIGYAIQSDAGKLEFIAKATADGQLNCNLKGISIANPNDPTRRIPYRVYYTNLTVNEQTIFNKVTSAWNDKPYRYSMDVKAGDEIKIHVEWQPKKSNV